jgi:hypothetical protein
MKRIPPSFSLALLLLSCNGDDAVPAEDVSADDEVPTLDPPPEGAGFQISMTGSAPAFSETWLCAVYDLPTTDYAAVNSVEFMQNGGTHHMTLSTLGLTGGDLEPGMYDCEELYGNSSLMQDQIMFFGNQGDVEGVLTLPQGVVANLPPGLQIIHEVHYVNVTDADLPLYSVLNAWTIPQDEITNMVWGGSVRDETIAIPAAAEHSEWSRCVMNEDVEVVFLASHMHAKGVEFTIAEFDGTDAGEVFYTNDDWHNPKITQYDAPLTVPAGEGFEWTCTWDNTGDEPVQYGPTAEDEMCNLAVVFTPFSMTAACEVVETSDGVLWEQ